MIKYYLFLNILMSLLTILIYYIDKKRAIKNKYRIKESTLLSLSLFFGSIGGLISLYVIRHKNRKIKFILCNWIFFFIHILIGLLILLK